MVRELFAASEIARRSGLLVVKRGDMFVDRSLHDLAHLHRVREQNVIHEHRVTDGHISDT